MVDLHTHTTASDGSFAPGRLVAAAREAGLEALAITDHDTFAGYDEARPVAEVSAVDLICGIELGTRMPDRTGSRGTSVHLLGYFPGAPPTGEFRGWLGEVQEARRDRNRRLAARLQELGLDVTIEEVNKLGGILTGRPHFARVLLDKGYVSSLQEAFSRYLNESGPAYVRRAEPGIPEGIRRIRSGNGIAVLAHPVRLRLPADEEEVFLDWIHDQGLQGIEAYHSDQDAAAQSRYRGLADRHGLLVTGGSDFHGDYKPAISLGVGPGHLNTPFEVVERLRELG